MHHITSHHMFSLQNKLSHTLAELHLAPYEYCFIQLDHLMTEHWWHHLLSTVKLTNTHPLSYVTGRPWHILHAIPITYNPTAPSSPLTNTTTIQKQQSVKNKILQRIEHRAHHCLCRVHRHATPAHLNEPVETLTNIIIKTASSSGYNKNKHNVQRVLYTQ